MKITDITGRIHNGMWSYGQPFPEFEMTPLKQPEWVETTVYCEVFGGMNSQTGTYLETPAHLLGYEKSYTIADVPIEKLYEMPTVLLQVRPEPCDGRPAITAEMLEEAARSVGYKPSETSSGALVVSCGCGAMWDSPDYLTKCPYFTLEAMRWLIRQKPFVLASDVPRWENLEEPQGFFPEFYAADILMLAPVVNTERVESSRARLTVLPMAIDGSCCVPARAVIIEE